MGARKLGATSLGAQLGLDTPAAVCQNVADAIWAVAASMSELRGLP